MGTNAEATARQREENERPLNTKYEKGYLYQSPASRPRGTLWKGRQKVIGRSKKKNETQWKLDVRYEQTIQRRENGNMQMMDLTINLKM